MCPMMWHRVKAPARQEAQGDEPCLQLYSMSLGIWPCYTGQQIMQNKRVQRTAANVPATCHLPLDNGIFFSLYAMFRNYLKSKLHPLTHTHTRIIAWAFYCLSFLAAAEWKCSKAATARIDTALQYPVRRMKIYVYGMCAIEVDNMLNTYATIRGIMYFSNNFDIFYYIEISKIILTCEILNLLYNLLYKYIRRENRITIWIITISI